MTTFPIPLVTGAVPGFDTQEQINLLIQSINNALSQFPAGAGTSTLIPSGVITAQLTSTGTGADTTEDVLQTFSLPANTLSAIGKGVRIRAWGTCAANANNKTMKLYFGASVVATPTAATNAKNWMLSMDVWKTAANAQAAIGAGIVDTTAVTPYVNAGADTDTAAIVIKVTGTNGTGTANDIVCKGMIVEMLN